MMDANLEAEAAVAEEWSDIPYYERRNDHWQNVQSGAIDDEKAKKQQEGAPRLLNNHPERKSQQ